MNSQNPQLPQDNTIDMLQELTKACEKNDMQEIENIKQRVQSRFAYLAAMCQEHEVNETTEMTKITLPHDTMKN